MTKPYTQLSHDDADSLLAVLRASLAAGQHVSVPADKVLALADHLIDRATEVIEAEYYLGPDRLAALIRKACGQ